MVLGTDAEMLKNLFCCVMLLGVFSFSVYFWYHLNYSNVTDLIKGYKDLLYISNDNRSEDELKSDVYSHVHTDLDLWKTRILKENNVTTATNISKATVVTKVLNNCPDPSPFLVGPTRVEFSTPVSLDTVIKENPHLQVGGRYKPDNCVTLQKVAVIIPFRNREEHLKFWLHYLHPFLQRQQLDYGVYIIEQDGENTFNKAKLMNIGYTEALKEFNYDCFVFSDVDIIPMDDRNTYRCFSQPRHLAVALDKFGFELPYIQIFGGVTSLSKEQMLKINGFSNTYWGWGGEDDDIFNRLNSRGMSISRPNNVVGKCRMISHTRDINNDINLHRYERMANTLTTMDKDGLNSLEYKVVTVKKHILFTKISVDVGEPIQENRG